ncbi:hypothetical protein GCM10027418_30150 [Mariniluteicoccus endophyticus]
MTSNEQHGSREAIRDLMSSVVVDRDGEKVGSVGQLFLDDETGKPSWVTVNTGLFGSKETFIPLNGAQKSGDEIRVPFDKALIKDAPSREVGDHLTPDEEDTLYSHYGLPTSSGTSGHDHDRREGGMMGDRDHDGKPNALDRNDHDGRQGGMGTAAGLGAAGAQAGMAGRRNRLRPQDDMGQQGMSDFERGFQAAQQHGPAGGGQQGMSDFERGFQAAQQQGVGQPEVHQQGMRGQQPGMGMGQQGRGQQDGMGQQDGVGQQGMAGRQTMGQGSQQFVQQGQQGDMGQEGHKLRDRDGDLRDAMGDLRGGTDIH